MLATSGLLSLGGATSGRSVNLELGRAAAATTSLGESAVRSLAGVASGSISMSHLYGKSRFPAAGTLLTTYCSGYTLYGRYANGSGGTYDQVIEYNSTTCGYYGGSDSSYDGGSDSSYDSVGGGSAEGSAAEGSAEGSSSEGDAGDGEGGGSDGGGSDGG